MKKRIIASVTAVCMIAVSMTGCTEAQRATYNVQKEADYFNVERRLSVINARTDKPILELRSSTAQRSAYLLLRLKLLRISIKWIMSI